MADETKTTTTPTGNEQDYIDQIQKLKESTVSKEEYEKLVADNKKLIETLADGGKLDTDKPKEKVDVDEIRKKLYSEDCQLSNLEYCKNTLKLRAALIEEGNPDPFLPAGKNIAPTAEDIECAERVAEVMQNCIEYADGDSELFTNELMRLTKDVAPLAGKKR